jgi:TatD DNase family protein
VVVHSRQADQETFAVLRDWAKGRHPNGPLGVLHCFAGDMDLAIEYAQLGFMLSIAGNVTYPNARRLQAVAAGVPLEHLLVETDCPFLPPQSQRGRRSEPAHVRETIEFIASLRGVEAGLIAAATTANARRLYRLESEGKRA